MGCLDLVGIGAIHVENSLIDVFEFYGIIKTVLDALGIASAQVTLVSQLVVLVETHSPERTGPYAHAAADTLIGIDFHRTGFFIAHQGILLGAGLDTGSPPTLQTDIGVVEKILGYDRYLDARPCRVYFIKIMCRTGKLAQSAGCTFFKIDLDEFAHRISFRININYLHAILHSCIASNARAGPFTAGPLIPIFLDAWGAIHPLIRRFPPNLPNVLEFFRQHL
jgi:hypothetical protein